MFEFLPSNLREPLARDTARYPLGLSHTFPKIDGIGVVSFSVAQLDKPLDAE